MDRCRLWGYENTIQRDALCICDWIGDFVLFCAVDYDAGGERRGAQLVGVCGDLVASVCGGARSEGGSGSVCDAGGSGGVFRDCDWGVGVLFPGEARGGTRGCLKVEG